MIALKAHCVLGSSSSSLQTACVRTPGCVAVVWDHSQLDFCWTLKAAAAPAVFNADKDLIVIEERATAADEQGKNPGTSIKADHANTV
jgi:hypothetical protein